MTIWQVLGIEVTTDLKIIRQAYASKLKENKPEINPKGFALLRKSYELAVDHAAGNRIDFELNAARQTHQANKLHQEKNQSAQDNPIARVLILLEALEADEEKAVIQLENYKKEKIFDDLEYAEDFENILLINLLPESTRHPLFICYLINFFNWNNACIKNKKDTYVKLALINLLNQAAPYQFLSVIKNLKAVKNRTQAKKLNVKWTECCAAKILFNPPDMVYFFYYKYLNYKIKRSMYSLVEHISKNYPQIIGLGINLYSFTWWHKKLQKKINRGGKMSPFIYASFYFVMFLFVSMLNHNFFSIIDNSRGTQYSDASDQKNKNPPTNSHLSPPDPEQWRYNTMEKNIHDHLADITF